MSGKRLEGFGKRLVSTLVLPRLPRQEKQENPINIFGKMVSTQENTQTRAHARARTRGSYSAYHAYRLPTPTTRSTTRRNTELDKMTRDMVEWKYSRDRTPAQQERDTK
jgi:hypothetical protein